VVKYIYIMIIEQYNWHCPNYLNC